MLTLISIMLFFSALGLGVEAGPGPYAASLTFMLFLAGYAYLQALKMLLRVHPGEVAYLIVTRARVLALHTSDQHSDAAGGRAVVGPVAGTLRTLSSTARTNGHSLRELW